jgi:hypothetical protein
MPLGSSVAFDEARAGRVANARQEIDNEAALAENKYLTARIAPINEMIALLLILDLMRAAQVATLKSVPNAATRDGYAARFADINRQFGAQMADLAHALRYHNYTARGFATMIEVLFKVDISHEHARR